ncbi:MAG: hypothetical protein JKY46_04200 [Robiginitomaculum sp.]|nr:hypothetical protein [Robiginitomaculum sp.]
MSKLDEAIREALNAEDAEQLEYLAAPQGMWARLWGVLRSHSGPLAWYGIVLQFVTLGFAIWAGWNFYFAPNGREMALWGALAGLMILMQTFLKFWFIVQMDKMEILREIKRLELQVALLAQKQA